MENLVTLTITIPNTMAFGSKVAGEWLPMDLAKAHNSYLVEVLRYGAQRWTNDRAKGDSPQQRLDIGRLLMAEINSGKELPMRQMRASQVSTVQGKARKLAHAAIRDYFAASGGDYKAAYGGKTAGDQNAMRDKWIEKNPELLVTAQVLLEQEAQAQVAAKAAIAANGADLASIFG